MFSPYYARARRRTERGAADPLDHCAINVALYGRDGRRWSMTERGRARLQRDARHLQFGPSALRWHGDELHITLDEIAVPWPSRIRGSIRVHAPRRFARSFELAPGHHWQPIAPHARVEVDLGGVCWSGAGYLDSNRGDAPLEQAFHRWDWSRAHFANGDSAVVYDIERLHSSPLQIGLRFSADGRRIEPIALPPRSALPAGLWGVARGAHSDADAPARLLQTLTDAPFYTRSLLGAQWCGEPVTVVHESLSLARFDTAWVQAMLPFRMPRRR